jgi:hypothetical protein
MLRHSSSHTSFTSSFPLLSVPRAVKKQSIRFHPAIHFISHTASNPLLMLFSTSSTNIHNICSCRHYLLPLLNFSHKSIFVYPSSVVCLIFHFLIHSCDARISAPCFNLLLSGKEILGIGLTSRITSI